VLFRSQKARIIGSNQGKYTVLLNGKKRRIDQYTHQLLRCVIANLSD